MKKKIITISSFIFLFLFPVTALPQLTDSEINGLMLLKAEEKVAYDVYCYMYAKYEIDVFKNIAFDEKEHMNKLKDLIKLYGLSDPVPEQETKGIYNNKKMQAMYDEMIMSGEFSLADALRAAGRFEEQDIQDIRNWSSVTTDKDVLSVYSELESSSWDHLRALVKFIRDEGITYKPCILRIEEFNKYMSADPKKDKSE